MRARPSERGYRRSDREPAARGYSAGLFDELASHLRSGSAVRYAAFAVALIVLIAVPIAAMRNASAAAQRTAEEEAAQKAAAAEKAEAEEAEIETLEDLDFELTPDLFDDIPVEDGLQPFSLSDLDGPTVDSGALSDVEEAISAIEERGGASVVFVDAQTGRGVAYQPDLVRYGASSLKALYALYVCEDLVESGEVFLDDYCPIEYAVDATDGYTSGYYQVYDLIEAAILQSNNNAYGALRDSFDSEGFDEWVTSLGANDAVCRADSWFPIYCARSSARLWAEMLAYIETGSEFAEWLADLTSRTEVSFIRDGLEGTGATVLDKAGWCTDSDPAYNSVSDAGIVEIDGVPYIMSILTGMPDSEENRELVGDLARALLACRDDLAL